MKLLNRVETPPWWTIPLATYAITRAVSGVILLLAADRQPEIRPGNEAMLVVEPLPASPSYFELASNWDGQWYKAIANRGYPSDLPRGTDGDVVRNEWAFFPLYPAVVRAGMAITGLSFEVVGALVALLAGAAAVVILYRFLDLRVGTFAAWAIVASLCTFPTAPVLQVTYTEGLALLLLVLALVSLAERRYGIYVLTALLLAFTRPVLIPLALTVGVHWLARLREAGWRLPPRQLALGMGLTVTTAGAAATWPLVAWLVTGERRAFLETQEAWRTNDDSSVLAAGIVGQALEGRWILIGVVLSV